MLDIEHPVYASEDGYWHINFECESIAGGWTVARLEDALADPALRPCDACGSIYYLDGVPKLTSADVSAPGSGGLSAIANGDALVYFSERNACYHQNSVCQNAVGITLTPGHLSDALLAGKTRCPVCEPVEPELSENP